MSSEFQGFCQGGWGAAAPTTIPHELFPGAEGAPGEHLQAIERLLRDSASGIYHDLFLGAECAPGDLFEAMERRIRDSAFVTPHDLFSGAECAPVELFEAMERRICVCVYYPPRIWLFGYVLNRAGDTIFNFGHFSPHSGLYDRPRKQIASLLCFQARR